MPLSRQAIASIAQLLGALHADVASVLLLKHFGVNLGIGVQGTRALDYLTVLEGGADKDVMQLLGEIVRESAAIRAKAPTEAAFDGSWHELERWLLHDGWTIEENQLLRVGPAAEEATGVRDALLEALAASPLDADGEIRRSIEDAAQAFIAEPPDLNASLTRVRTALETIVCRAAAARAAAGGPPYPTDRWGHALTYLRTAGVLDPDEEKLLARIYTFISPAAHVPLPLGITAEEWARLGRTFALGSSYFILKKHQAAPFRVAANRASEAERPG